MELLRVLGRLPVKQFLLVLAALSTLPSFWMVGRNLIHGDHLTAAVVGTSALLTVVLVAASRLERARVERALAAKSNQTEAILEASADAYVAMNPAGQITAWSGKSEETFGWTAEEAVGRTVTEMIVPHDMRAGHDGGLERYNRTGIGPVLGTRVELDALHRDGHKFPIELAVWEAKGDKEPVFVSFIHDITDRRQKEAELADARDSAMKASRLKSEFVANMSHEIRTPLNGVIGMADLLLRSDLTREQREYLDTIRLSADALLTVISDILDFSRIEAGKLQLEEREFELRDVVDDVGALIATTAQVKGVELIISVDAPVPVILCGDAGRLRQVLLNIAGNAVKFTDSGEVVVAVTLDEAATEGHTALRFSVRDTGPGISNESQNSLFESFSQGDASSTRRYGGTGLGLAISKRLVELMGGVIGVNSVPGEGSDFWFTIPFRAVTGSAGPILASLDALRGTSVLVVDDNATNRRILSGTLSHWGLSPVSVADGEKALEVMAAHHDEGHPFAIALLDFHMPGMDGAQLVRRMNDDQRFASIRKALLTSTGDRIDSGDERTRTLTKPVRQSLLFECLAEFAGAAIADKESEAPPGTTNARNQNQGAILLVEDNPVNQVVGLRMLRSLGFEADVAHNGLEAVKAVSVNRYSAVLMDCQMPEMDGYEATETIRQAETGRRLPIIAMTASAMEGDAERCLAAGMDDYLAKPVRMEELNDALARWIEVDDVASGLDDVASDGEQSLNLAVVGSIRDMAAGDDGAFAAMVDLFVKTIGDHIELLAAAAHARDLEEVRRVAHSVKGSTSVFGAEVLASQASRISTLAKAQPVDWSALHGLLAAMKVEFGEVERRLTAELADH